MKTRKHIIEESMELKPPSSLVRRQKMEERNLEIAHLHQRGYSTREIGAIMHLTHQQVSNILKAQKEQEG